ncbi:hypothetical protein LAZ67_5003410 [Cordylochernes scorpioides]|uniref:Uncharacterized protein n=1 Tax=Cordylochernes scorpioides TaxID=51811 RepID=A0ABY6KHA2_9ARAC|nr:hypothetical protein LAZ67_5003410 [Cordylochernes scorpioides]
MLKQAFEEDALSQSRTFEWFALFKAEYCLSTTLKTKNIIPYRSRKPQHQLWQTDKRPPRDHGFRLMALVSVVALSPTRCR